MPRRSERVFTRAKPFQPPDYVEQRERHAKAKALPPGLGLGAVGRRAGAKNRQDNERGGGGQCQGMGASVSMQCEPCSGNGTDASADAVLAAARESAREAAETRRPANAGGPQARAGPPAEVRTLSLPMVCRVGTTKCDGCGQPFGVGARMRSSGTRLVHFGRESCWEAAMSKQAARHAQLGVSPAAVVYELAARVATKKRAGMEGKVCGERTQIAMACLAGRCDKGDAPRMMCREGCGYGVHVACIGLAQSRLECTTVRCAMCRARSMTEPGKEPDVALVCSALKGMLWELSVGAHSTTQGYAEFARLEKDWVAQTGAENVLLPRDCEDSLVSFLVWLGADSGRARSFTSIWRAAAGVCAKTRPDDNLTKRPRVKGVYKDVAKSLGELGEPCTQATRRLLQIMFGLGEFEGESTLEAACRKGQRAPKVGAEDKAGPMLCRQQVLTVGEAMGGFRVGEMTGDVHGIAANGCSVLTPLTSENAELGVTIEMKTNDSKTGPGRFVNFVGTSFTSGVPAEKYFRNMWATHGVSVTTSVDGGYRIERPDYWVARINLLGMSDLVFGRVVKALSYAKDTPKPGFRFCGAGGDMSLLEYPSVGTSARTSIRYASRAHSARNIDEERRYVNIAGGPLLGGALKTAERWASDFGMLDFLVVVPGPLLRAFESGGRITHMPLQEGSTYGSHIDALKAAFKISSEIEEPDMELELAGAQHPHWANHSLRRFADRVARDTSDRSGMTATDIDAVFGWNEKKRMMDMQTHYEGLNRAKRVHRSRVTMYV
jgi:hypothetical protein